MRYFFLADILLMLIYRIQISLPLLVNSTDVADCDRVYDVLIARNPCLILGHLGFSAKMDQFDLDFFSISMPLDDYSDLHTLPRNRTLLRWLFYSSIARSFYYIDRYYSFPDQLLPDIPLLDSPIPISGDMNITRSRLTFVGICPIPPLHVGLPFISFPDPFCVLVVGSSWFFARCMSLPPSTLSGVYGLFSLAGGAGGGGFDAATLFLGAPPGTPLSSLLSSCRPIHVIGSGLPFPIGKPSIDKIPHGS